MTSPTPSGLLVLAADDEPIVLRAVTSALTLDDIAVVVAENGAAWLEAFLQNPEVSIWC